MRISKGLLIGFLALLLSGFVGCANKELAQVQDDVTDIHSRLYQIQRSSERQTSVTTDTLQRVTEKINASFEEIRFTQSSLEEKISQLSNRLLEAERQLESLQSGQAQIRTQLQQESRALRQEMSAQKQELESSIQKTASDVSELRKELASLESSQQRDIQALRQNVGQIENNLSTRMDNLDKEVQGVYRDIMEELGGTAPGTTTASQSSDSQSYSGQTYTVAPGDTLGGIAQAFGITREALQDANGITDPNMIRVGQVLKIPK